MLENAGCLMSTMSDEMGVVTHRKRDAQMSEVCSRFPGLPLGAGQSWGHVASYFVVSGTCCVRLCLFPMSCIKRFGLFGQFAGLCSAKSCRCKRYSSYNISELLQAPLEAYQIKNLSHHQRCRRLPCIETKKWNPEVENILA